MSTAKLSPTTTLFFKRPRRWEVWKEGQDLPSSHLPVFFIHCDLDRLCTLEDNFLENYFSTTFLPQLGKRRKDDHHLLLTASLSGSFSIMLEQIWEVSLIFFYSSLMNECPKMNLTKHPCEPKWFFWCQKWFFWCPCKVWWWWWRW